MSASSRAPLVLRLEPQRKPLAPPLALLAIGGVAALEGLEPIGRELEHTGHRRVEEVAIMRDRQQRAAEAREPLAQPGAAVGVEVIRRLVEQQHGRLGERHRGQQTAGRLAAGDAAERRAPVEVRDPQPAARLVQPRLERPAPECLEARLRLAVGLEVGQLGLQRIEPQPHLPDLAQRGA